MSSMNEHKSPEELEREVEEVRENVRHTLDDIRDSLSPGQMVDHALDYMRGSGGAEFTRNLGRSVRDNPVPVALIGAGIGWLMLSDRFGGGGGMFGRSRPRYTADELYTDPDTHHVHVDGEGRTRARVRGAAERASGAVHSATERASGAMHSASERASGAMHSASDRLHESGSSASGAAHSARERAGESAASFREGARRMSHDTRDHVSESVSAARGYARSAGERTRHYGEEIREGVYEAGERVREYGGYAGRRMRSGGARLRDGAYDARDQVARVVEEQPLILGAVGFVIGAVIGAALPSSRTENRLFGSTADRVKRGARDMAREGVREAGNAASEAVHEVGRTLDEHGWSTRNLADTVHDVGDDVREAIDPEKRREGEGRHNGGERKDGASGSSASRDPATAASRH